MATPAGREPAEGKTRGIEKVVQMKKWGLVFLATALFTGCGGDDDDIAPAGSSVFGKAYTIVTGTPEIATDSISGTGTISFGDSLLVERAEETNFLFTIDLSKGNDSFVALHSFSEADLSGGQLVTFSRTNDGSFVLRYTKKDGLEGEVTSFNEAVDATASFTVSVDVHNGEDNGSHVISWIGDDFPSEPAEAEDGIFGAGKFTGLSFQNATITAFRVGAAEAKDEE